MESVDLQEDGGYVDVVAAGADPESLYGAIERALTALASRQALYGISVHVDSSAMPQTTDLDRRLRSYEGRLAAALGSSPPTVVRDCLPVRGRPLEPGAPDPAIAVVGLQRRAAYALAVDLWTHPDLPTRRKLDVALTLAGALGWSGVEDALTFPRDLLDVVAVWERSGPLPASWTAIARAWARQAPSSARDLAGLRSAALEVHRAVADPEVRSLFERDEVRRQELDARWADQGIEPAHPAVPFVTNTVLRRAVHRVGVLVTRSLAGWAESEGYDVPILQELLATTDEARFVMNAGGSLRHEVRLHVREEDGALRDALDACGRGLGTMSHASLVSRGAEPDAVVWPFLERAVARGLADVSAGLGGATPIELPFWPFELHHATRSDGGELAAYQALDADRRLGRALRRPTTGRAFLEDLDRLRAELRPFADRPETAVAATGLTTALDLSLVTVAKSVGADFRRAVQAVASIGAAADPELVARFDEGFARRSRARAGRLAGCLVVGLVAVGVLGALALAWVFS